MLEIIAGKIIEPNGDHFAERNSLFIGAEENDAPIQ